MRSAGGAAGRARIAVRARPLLYHAYVTVPEHMHVDVRRVNDRVVLSLHGELDLASAPILERELEHAETGDDALVLDLEALEFVDSTGLRIILAAHGRAREHGYEFAVTRGSRQIQRLLDITRVGEHLRIIESPDELLV